MSMRLKRINEIEQYIIRKKSATINELCEISSTSLNTMRSYINELEKRKILTKVYGGVVLNKDIDVLPYNARSASFLMEKMIIGELASEFLVKDETIYIDSGSTTVHLIKHIKPDMNITVVTNSITVINEAQKYPPINIILIGGLYYYKTNSLVGHISNLGDYRINKVFLAAKGVSLEGGVTNNSFHETNIVKYMMGEAKEVILLADNSKVNQTSTIHLCNYNSLTAFITDSKPSDEFVKGSESSGVIIRYGQKS